MNDEVCDCAGDALLGTVHDSTVVERVLGIPRVRNLVHVFVISIVIFDIGALPESVAAVHGVEMLRESFHEGHVNGAGQLPQVLHEKGDELVHPVG